MGTSANAQGLDSKGAQQLVDFVTQEVKSRLGSTLTLLDLYYGVEALGELSPSSIKNLPAAEACKLATAPASTLADHFYSATVIQRLGCSGADQAVKAAEAAATAALAAPATTDDGYYATGILSALKAAGKKPKIPSLAALSALLKELPHSSGAIRASQDAKMPSFAATGKAYATIAAAKGLASGFAVSEVESAVSKVLALSKPDGGIWGKQDPDHLESTARVLAGAVALKAAKASGDTLAKTAGFLSQALPAGSLSDAYFAAAGLKTLSGGTSLPAGVLLTPVSATGAGGMGRATVTLTTAFGDAKPSCTVTGTATPKSGKAAPVTFSFKAGPNGAYAAVFQAPAGAYTIEAKATDCEDDGSGLAAVATFDGVVAAKGQVTDLSVSAGSGKSLTAAYPEKLGSKLTLAHESQIKVSFKVTVGGNAITPSQAMAVLTSKTRPSAAAYFPAKLKGEGLVASITSGGVEKQLGTLGGGYSLALLVGDAAIETPVQWSLGDVAVSFKPLDDGSQPDDPAQFPAAFQPRPTILHMHRPPEKQPPAVVSLVFAAVTLAPLLLVLAVALGSLKANFKGMAGNSAALVFHGSILAILGLYWAFWTKLNLLQTLPILSVLALLTFFSGYFALSAHADSRLKNE